MGRVGCSALWICWWGYRDGMWAEVYRGLFSEFWEVSEDKAISREAFSVNDNRPRIIHGRMLRMLTVEMEWGNWIGMNGRFTQENISRETCYKKIFCFVTRSNRDVEKQCRKRGHWTHAIKNQRMEVRKMWDSTIALKSQ